MKSVVSIPSSCSDLFFQRLFLFTMDTLSFKDLSDSILSLFETNKEYGYAYNCVLLLDLNQVWMEAREHSIIQAIGELKDFHDWLEPRLEEFFTDFGVKYFCTPDKRMNQRRYYAYKNIVKNKSCKRKLFKRRMMKEFYLDITSFRRDGDFVGEYTQTEASRRILFFAGIKNYVFRLFLIDEYSYP